jgi:hypothetical protein
VAPTLRRQLPTGEPGGGPTATRGSAGVVSRQTEDRVPVALPAEPDQRMADESTLSEERAVSVAQERDDPIQERRDEVPRALVPRVMHRSCTGNTCQLTGRRPEWTSSPRDSTVARSSSVVASSRKPAGSQQEDEAWVPPQGEEVADQTRPDRQHTDLGVGQQARQAPLDARRGRGAQATKRLRDSGQTRRSGQDDAQDEEGERLTPVAMQCRQHGPQLVEPLAPQPLWCVHTSRAFLSHDEVLSVLAWY